MPLNNVTSKSKCMHMHKTAKDANREHTEGTASNEVIDTALRHTKKALLEYCFFILMHRHGASKMFEVDFSASPLTGALPRLY